MFRQYFPLVLVTAALAVTSYLWFVPQTVNKPQNNINTANLKTATFAGGCFWCTETDFEKLTGVAEATSGYMGGSAETATYKQTSAGNTGHREVVQVTYDSTLLSYKDLVDYHWRHFDPTDNEGQFADRGFVYSPAVFYSDESEQAAAIQSLKELNALKVFPVTIEVPIVAASTFYKAEEYHQDYYLKHPTPYKTYRRLSGRDAFLNKYWK